MLYTPQLEICVGTNRRDCRLRRWKENNELDHARVKLPTRSELHFPTFKVPVVPLVTRVPYPQVVSAKSWLMLNPGEDEFILLLSGLPKSVIFVSYLYESSDDVDERRRISMDDDLWLERNNARKTSVLSPVEPPPEHTAHCCLHSLHSPFYI